MRNSLGLLAVLTLTTPLLADDWPGFRGADRSGVSKETGLLKQWPKGGPKLAWSTSKAGNGLSGMAVVKGIVYTMGLRDQDEYAIALDKGKEVWATKIGPTLDWKENQWSSGPNSTPTVAGDHVFVLTSRGVLACVKKDGGDLVWKKDMVAQMGGVVHVPAGGAEGLGWGYCWSPLVEDGHVLAIPGGKKGALALLDAKTGNEVWRTKDITDVTSYGSPVVATLGGVKQYLYASQTALYGVSAKTGSLLWSRKHEDPADDLACAVPLVKGDRVYYSIGYTAQAALVEVSGKNGKFTTKDVWAKDMIGNRQGGTVLVGDHVYGFHQDFQWQCQELKSGEIVWGKDRKPQALKAESGRVFIKSGAAIAADDKLFVVTEDGKVALLAATPTSFSALSLFDLKMPEKPVKPSVKVWTHPSLSDGKLYLRNQGDVFCYEVK